MHRIGTYIVGMLISCTALCSGICFGEELALPLEGKITALAMGSRGNMAVATSDGNIGVVNPGNTYVRVATGVEANCIVVTPRGEIYAGSAKAGRLVRITLHGDVQTVRTDVQGIRGIEADRDGNLYIVSDQHPGSINKVIPNQ